METTLLGLFQDRHAVEDVIEILQAKNFKPENFSIVMKDSKEAKSISRKTGVDVAGGATTGAATGAVIGGIAGLVAATMIPGLGAFLIGGPIASALGLTGAAAATISGATTGAVAGGLLGALMGMGLSREDAKRYESHVNAGAILLAVPIRDTEEEYVRDLFERHNATEIKSIAPQHERFEQRMTSQHFADREPETRDNSGISLEQPHVAAFGMKGGQTRQSDETTETTGTETQESGRKGGMSFGTQNRKILAQDYIINVDYPCTKVDLVRAAATGGADDTILRTFVALPEREFATPEEVRDAIGHIE